MSISFLQRAIVSPHLPTLLGTACGAPPLRGARTRRALWVAEVFFGRLHIDAVLKVPKPMNNFPPLNDPP